MEHKISQKNIGFGLFIEARARQESSNCEDSKMFLAYFRAIQGHSGGITIDPELMEHILIPYNWKE